MAQDEWRTAVREKGSACSGSWGPDSARLGGGGMQYNPLDDVPHSIRASLRPHASPTPSHYSIVTASPPQVRQPDDQQDVKSLSGVPLKAEHQAWISLQCIQMSVIFFHQIREHRHGANFINLKTRELLPGSSDLKDLAEHVGSLILQKIPLNAPIYHNTLPCTFSRVLSSSMTVALSSSAGGTSC